MKYENQILDDGKKCLTKEAVKPSKDVKDFPNGALAVVNTAVANVLNTRGVYTGKR